MSNPACYDRVFKALGNAVRRSILDTLRDQPQTTGALCDRFGDLDRCTVMMHLRVLEDADLVIAKRRGRERWNHLNPLPIHDIHERWIGPHASDAVARLARLKRTLERDGKGGSEPAGRPRSVAAGMATDGSAPTSSCGRNGAAGED